MGNIGAFRLSNDNTVDRVTETDFILDVIKKQTADLLIIYAESGIGKSTLANRVLKNLPIEMIPVCVKTNPENNSVLLEEGGYLNRVFNCCVNLFHRYKDIYPKNTFDYFVSHNKSCIIKKDALESMFGSISPDNIEASSEVALGKYVASRLFKLYEYNSYNKLSLPDKNSMLIAHEYIKYLLKNQSICINIDNIQNIDYYSFELLIEWVSVATRGSFFLFEYTINQVNDTHKLIQLATRFQNLDMDVQLLPLGGLDFENSIQALKKSQPSLKRDDKFFEELKVFYIHHSRGNMQKLLDFGLKYSADSILKKGYDPTYEKLAFLPSNAKYITAIIILHGGEMEAALLKHIISSSVVPLVIDYERQIENLIEAEIIKENGQLFSIYHASLTDSWHNHEDILNKYNLTAFKNSTAYYERELQNKSFNSTENIEQALFFLLKTYAKYAPEKILSIVQEMKFMVSERIRPEQIFEFFLMFLEYIKGQEHLHIDSLYEMMLFCFHHGLFKNCLYLLQLLEDIPSECNKDIIFIYKVNCIEYLELHQEAIELCNNRLEEPLDNRQKYNCFLLLIGCHRSLNQMSEVLTYVNNIKNIPSYQNYNEYGIFLRLSEIYMSRKEALPFVADSIIFFKNNKNSFMEAKSRITYAFLLAVTDDISKAHKELEICEKLVESTHYWESVIYLNKAAMLLLQNNYGNDVELLLKKAELMTNSSFDLLLILTLQLINKTEARSEDKDHYLLKRICRLLAHETDKHLIALVAYDLYLYFQRNTQPEKSDEYHKIAIKTQEYNETVKCHLAHKVNPNTPNLFKTKWCIGFTFFWNVDYNDY